MGTPDFAVNPLHALAEAGYEVTGVVTQPDKPKGRGKSMLPTPVKEEALKHGFPVYQPVKVRDPEFLQVLEKLDPDIIVVAAFGQIIPKSILELPKYGCINIHATLLPKYRGAAPIQQAVIDGEKESGVTIMRMGTGLDTGDMISKITALYDWIFEEKAGCGEVNDFAVMIAKKAVNSFVRTPYESIKDELFLKELLDSLAMSGIANEIAGSSAPTSGSEHLISHALDKILEVPQLHGIQVGIATYIMAKVQDHRYIRVSTVLKDTGFWDYVATLHMKKADFLKAIDMAPTIKPHRHTYLHEEKYREAAKKLVLEDEVLNRVLED